MLNRRFSLGLLCAELLLLTALGSGVAKPGETRRAAATAEAEDQNSTAAAPGSTDSTRTTTFGLSTSVDRENVLWNSTSTFTTTVTTEFSCPLPLALEDSELVQYTDCIKGNCKEMASDVMSQASGGLITSCFLLLEAAGSCAGDAVLQVTALSSLGSRFEVGDLCGPLCPSHCRDEAITTSDRSELTTSRTESVFQDEPNEQVSSTSSPLTTLDLVAAAGRLRVLMSSLTFRISSPEQFVTQTGIRKALRDGIASSLVVSPSQVVVLDVVPVAEGQVAAAEAGNLRRLQAAGQIRVPFEILNAPHFLDANQLLAESTAEAMEVHLRQLFATVGIMGSISDLRLEEPEVIFREVAKRETTEDEWFFTYPVDNKIGDQMEPLEPGITSDSSSGLAAVRALTGLLGLCFFLMEQ